MWTWAFSCITRLYEWIFDLEIVPTHAHSSGLIINCISVSWVSLYWSMQYSADSETNCFFTSKVLSRECTLFYMCTVYILYVIASRHLALFICWVSLLVLNSLLETSLFFLFSFDCALKTNDLSIPFFPSAKSPWYDLRGWLGVKNPSSIYPSA